MAETTIGALAIEFTADVRNFVQNLDQGIKALNKKKAAVESAMIGVGKLAGAIGLAGGAMAAFVLRATNMAEGLAKMSEKTGISVEKLSSLKFAADQADVSMETLGRGLNILAKNMVEAQQNTGDARDAFKALGVSVTDSQGQFKTTDQVLAELADTFAQMVGGPEKAAYAMKVFGKSGAELIPLLNMGSAGLAKLREEAERLGIVIDTQTAKEAQEFNDELKKVKATTDALSIQLAGPFVKAWKDVATAMLEAKKNGDGFLQTLGEIIRLSVSGGDLQMARNEMAKLGAVLGDAEREVSEKRREMNAAADGYIKEQWAKQLAAAEAHLAKVKARMEVVKGQIAVFSGDFNRRPAGEGEEGFVGPPKPPKQIDAVESKEEAAARVQREQEIRDALHKAQVENDARKLAQIQFEIAERERLEEEARQRRYEQYEREENEEVERGRRKIEQRRWELEQKKKQERDFYTFMGNMAGLMNTQSKKMFEVGKAFAIADAGIKGAHAVMAAWDAGMSTGGPWAPVVAAVYAGAAALNAANLINNIRSQQFGGGGGVPIAPTQGSSGVSEAGAGGGSTGGNGQSGGQTTVVRLMGGDMFSRKQVRDLLEVLNDNTRDGGRVVIQ